MSAIGIAWGILVALDVLLGLLLLDIFQSLGGLLRRVRSLQNRVWDLLESKGLPQGRRSPPLTPHQGNGKMVSLRNFAGRKRVFLLIFVKNGCQACPPEDRVQGLNRLRDEGEFQGLLVKRGPIELTHLDRAIALMEAALSLPRRLPPPIRSLC
jgi:hypothetical protein